MKGRLERLWGYIVEMYPPHINVPYSLMSFFGFYLLLEALVGFRPLTIGLRAILGAFTLACFTLLLRIFDEFKDYEHDVRLFAHRPLPSGRVTHQDLRILARTLVGLMVVLNLAIGLTGFMGFALLLAYGLLMLKFFFLAGWHRRSLLLTLVTHNPVAIVSQIYILAVFLQVSGRPLSGVPPAAWAAIVMFWLPVLAWETARKIRAPDQEDDYVTYSRVLGTRIAPLVPLTAIAISAAIALETGHILGLGELFGALLLVATAFSIGGLTRFIAQPVAAHSKLRPFAEAYGLALYVLLIGALVISCGITMSISA